MRGQDDRRRRHLVQVPNLQPDDPILDLVDDPDPVPAAELGNALSSSTRSEPLAVDGHRAAALEADPDQLGLVGGVLGTRHQLEDVVARR